MRRVRLLVLIGSLSAFGPLSIDMYLPAFPRLSRDFHAQASTVQLTLTACLVGLAAGQLVAGPLSDRFGRRRPLLLGLAAYAAASVLCALAPSVYALTAFRLVQGAAGAAGIVISRAVVRDLYEGRAIARIFALLMLVNGLAPMLAPTIGAAVLRLSSWRGVFVVLAAIGGALLVASAVGLGETLPPERRRSGGLRAVARTIGELVRSRIFVGYLLTLGLAFGSMFSYIAGSSFVLQDVHGVSPQLYGAIFGANALGIVAAGQASGLLVGRFGARPILAVGVASATAGSVALLAVVALGGGLAGIVPSLFVAVASMGLILPNATALALADHPQVAGSASGLIGVFQFAAGALAAPLVGVAGSRSAYPMAIAMTALSATALVVLHAVARLTRSDVAATTRLQPAARPPGR